MSEPSPETPTILLVGTDISLLEGLSQSLVSQGHVARIAASFAEARESAAARPPLIVVIERGLATASVAEVLGIKLSSGGAVVLYRMDSGAGAAIPHVLQRHVLADLALPLERNRLSALVQRVADRAAAVGRGRISGENELTS